MRIAIPHQTQSYYGSVDVTDRLGTLTNFDCPQHLRISVHPLDHKHPIDGHINMQAFQIQPSFFSTIFDHISRDSELVRKSIWNGCFGDPKGHACSN